LLPGTGRSIVLNFFTPSYRILGRVFVGSSGMLGVMNDPNTSSIEVSEASMARLHEPKKIADRTQSVRLVKRGIDVIGVGREFDVGPTSVARGGYGRLTRYHVRVVTASFEMEGEMEWAGRFDLSSAVVEGGDFFPLFNATLRAINVADLFMKSPALLVNRVRIDFMRTLEEEE